MKNYQQKPTLLFLTSYPPRPCGIATFSQDSIRAIENKFGDSYKVEVCALENNTSDTYNYPNRVIYRLNTESFTDILNVASAINRNDSVKLIVMQFEFGLWGSNGTRVKDMLKLLEKPIITVFHTILSQPSEDQLSIMLSLGRYSDQLIVMTKRSKEILEKVYAIQEEKITVIPHGTHAVPWGGKQRLKTKYGLENKLVLSTFGFLGANKNIETSLKALPNLVNAFPNIRFLILGRTHPQLVKQQGEIYREKLEQMVEGLSLKDHVIFINKYLSLTELLEYLILTDIYLFSSKDPHQAVSGTFMYAMSCGCPIVSTPIPHAREMIDDSVGVFFDFENEQSLAMAIKPLLSDKALRKKMSLNAFTKTRGTLWENVAIAFSDVIRKVIPEYSVAYKIPPVSLKHIARLTDKFGIIQFSKITTPDKSTGYTIDDNARALIAMVMHFEATGDLTDLSYIDTYVNFIEFCQGRDGHFQNYVDKQLQFHILNEYVNLEDSNARTVWALGYLVSHGEGLLQSTTSKADDMLKKTASWIGHLRSPRAIALTIKGLYLNNQKYPSKNITRLIELSADKLIGRFMDASENNWLWFESYLTYANSLLPEALIYAYDVTQKHVFKKIAIASFDFLLNHTFKEDYLQVISNRGWMHKGQQSNQHGEQPIDVSYTIQTLDAFYTILKDPHYKHLMTKAFSWFLGNNQLRQTVFDTTSGGCHDGLEHDHVNLNQGAESTVCYLIARMTMERVFKTEETVNA